MTLRGSTGGVLLTVVVLTGIAGCADDDRRAVDIAKVTEPTASAQTSVADGASTTAAVRGATTTATDAPGTTLAVSATTAAEAPTTTAPTSITEAAMPIWETVVAPAECLCAGGGEYSYFIKHADPTKVVFFLEGGGACFNAGTCARGSSLYRTDVYLSPERWARTGIFDDNDERNPFAGWSMVYVPYCTGDVHLGNTTQDYGNGIVVNHKGYVNASTALNALAATFPATEQLMVMGQSAGSVPTPLYAGIASDLLPDARITVLADGSGAYPDLSGFNSNVSEAWGTMNAVPDWPTTADITPDDWSFPDLFVHAGTHDPDIVFARHDYAHDRAQSFFSDLAGLPPDDLLVLIDRNEAQIEAAGVPLYSFISPGSNHVVLEKPEFYTLAVDGVLLVDWVQMLVDGDPMSDHR